MKTYIISVAGYTCKVEASRARIAVNRGMEAISSAQAKDGKKSIDAIVNGGRDFEITVKLDS